MIQNRIREILTGRPVLVTGADGFVGSTVVETLLRFGAKVHVLIRATSSGGLHNLHEVRTCIRIHRGELTDKQAVTTALRALRTGAGKPVVFHLGAQTHVGESWGRPFETIATNVLGTLNLLQSVVDLGLELYSLDTAGSSEEFGNVSEEVRQHYRFDPNGSLILDECSPINPQSPYASAKVASDFLTRNYYRAYGIPGLVTRMFNNYGPRQNPRFVTATIITQALSGDCIRLGAVTPKRDFCFVRDGAMGHIHAALFGNPGQVYVYGSGRAISIGDWYEKIIQLGKEGGYWGDKSLETDSEGRGRLGRSEVEELRVDFRKLHELTGWKPQYTWEEGLKETIRWYAENRERWITRVDW